MTLKELEEKYLALKEYTKQMPPDIRSRCTVRTHAAGSIIHQKDMELTCFGIIVSGETRVINEFENGNVYMIERNKAVDFIGEVTILAGMEKTSVTIEAATPVTAAYISRQDAERWLKEDMNILSLVGRRIAYKLYRSSYSKGTRLFYPPSYMLLDYLVKYGNYVGFGVTCVASIYYNQQNKAAPSGRAGNQCKNLKPYHPSAEGGGIFRCGKREDHL